MPVESYGIDSRHSGSAINNLDAFEQNLLSSQWEAFSIQQLWKKIKPYRTISALYSNDEYHIYIFLTYFNLFQCKKNHKQNYTKAVQKNNNSKDAIIVTFTDGKGEIVSFEFVFSVVFSYNKKTFTRLYFSLNGQRYNNNHNITYTKKNKIVTIIVQGYKKFTITEGKYYDDPPEDIEVDVI